MADVTKLGNSDPSADFLAGLIRFTRSLRVRWPLIAGCLVVAVMLGAAYFLTAVRQYESLAEVFVLQTGGAEVEKNEGSAQRNLIDQMPNFERVLQSDSVIHDTLTQLPRIHRRDFTKLAGDRWVSSFRDRLSVSTVRRTNVIQVRYRSQDPQTAKTVVNQLLTTYLDVMNTMHQNSSLDTLRVLQGDLDKVVAELDEKEAEHLRMKTDSRVIFEREGKIVNVLQERVIELNKALIEAQKQSIDSRSLSMAVSEAFHNHEDLQEFAFKISPDTANELLKRRLGVDSRDAYTIGQLQRDLVEYQADFQKKSKYYGPNHPKWLDLQDKITRTQRFLSDQPKEAQRLANQGAEDLGPQLVEIARRRAANAAAHEQDLLAQFNHESNEALRLGRKTAEIALLDLSIGRLKGRESYLLVRIKNLALGKDQGIKTSIITHPQVNKLPVSPRLSIVGLLSLMGGVFGGCVLVVVRDLIDDRFRSPEDLRAQIGAPIIAIVRKMNPLAGVGLQSLYPFAKPNAVESEAFRSMRTTLDFSGEETRRLTISSTEPGDGKTTVMASLAVAFAQSGKRTLAIDGDMRRPGLTRLLQLTGKQGLSNILRDERPIEEIAPGIIVSLGQKNLDVIPAGPKPTNPVELLTGSRLEELVAWAELHYDQILIDAPPSLAVSDVQIIGRVVDGAIMAVRPDVNRRKMVLRAAETLTALGCRLVGLVVNQVTPKSGDDYSFYGYGYGDKEYGHDENAVLEADPVPLRKAA